MFYFFLRFCGRNTRRMYHFSVLKLILRIWELKGLLKTEKRILYSFLHRDYINHIHLLSFLLVPYASHTWSPLSVTSFS
jgi:hypothetical protein